MSDVRASSGFRSLVEQIQEKDGGADIRSRPARRRLTLPADSAERTSHAESSAAPQPTPTAPVRLLQRRWL